jgi:hypothetical protein
VEYRLEWGGDPEDLLITTSGRADVEALDEMVQAILADPHFRPGLKVLVDHRATVWSALGAADLRRRADALRRQAEEIGDPRMAFVVSNVTDFGIGRMLSSFLGEDVGFAHRPFQSIDEARDWLRDAT